MNKFLFLGIASILLNANALFSESQLDLPLPKVQRKIIQGPPGPQGPPGTFSPNFSSHWSDHQFEVPLKQFNGEVPFDHAQVSPVGIIQPIGENASYFLILNSGVYQILWNVTAQYQATTTNNSATISIYLFNVTQDVIYQPEMMATLQDREIKTISGQTTLFIPAGTIIQLQAHTTVSSTTLSSRTISITQIAL
ncbi:MAG: hypothetical protein ACSNEK_08215 [Parachlamydiaceae bacterium]